MTKEEQAFTNCWLTITNYLGPEDQKMFVNQFHTLTLEEKKREEKNTCKNVV